MDEMKKVGLGKKRSLSNDLGVLFLLHGICCVLFGRRLSILICVIFHGRRIHNMLLFILALAIFIFGGVFCLLYNSSDIDDEDFNMEENDEG